MFWTWNRLLALINYVQNTVFIRMVAAATINFSLAWVRLQTEGGSYSRVAFINFGPILDGVIHKNCSWFSKIALWIIEIWSSKKLPCCSKTNPRPSPVTEQASRLYLWSWPHPLSRICTCLQLLFEGSYYFFPSAATIRGAASIRINTVTLFSPTTVKL